MAKGDHGEPVCDQGGLDLRRVPVSSAKTSPLPASEPALPAPEAASGASMSDAFAFFDPATCSWRTYQVCLLTQQWDVFSETWPRAGMMRNGKASVQEPLVYLMCENESGFLPTPQASDGTFLKVNRAHLCSLKIGSYRHTSHQGIDGNAKMADIAFLVWGGQLNPMYVETMMGFPKNWIKL